MAIILQPSYSESSDSTTLTVTSLTGQYSLLNLGGWDASGAVNPKVIEALVAEIRIALRNSDGTFGTETTIDVFSDLPSDIGGTKDITAVVAGQGTKFAVGIYRIKYVVSGIWTSNGSIPFLVTDSQYVPLVKDLCDCRLKLAARLTDCGCCDELDEKLSEISYYFRLLDGAYQCGNIESMQKFIDKLQSLCDEDCDCG